MNYQEFIKNGLLKKEKISFGQVNKTIEKSEHNLKSAKILIENSEEEGGYQFAYEAMLLAGRALVFSYGFRPRTIGSHKIVVDFAEKVFGERFKILTHKFNKMRKKRHYLIYGIGFVISKTEAENAIKTAEKFIEQIKKIIQNKTPQQKLWKPPSRC